MTVRLKAATTADGEVRLVLPEGRHLERGGWFVAADTINAEQRLLGLRVWATGRRRVRV